MRNEFEYATYAQQVVFGAGAFDRLGATSERLGWRRLLVCTSRSARRTGRVAQIEKALGARLVAVYDQVQSHVPSLQVDEAQALAERHAIDAVIGLGGGSSVGMAKAVSHALQEKRADDPRRAEPQVVSVIAIPTTYAGSEMTSVFGVTHTGTHGTGAAGASLKITVTDPRVTPRLVIYDPQLTLDLPPDITAATGINALAHGVEAVYSITRNPLSTAAALDAIRHLATALPRCYSRGDDLDARTEMLVGSYLAGTALSTVAMGLHHGICHVLGGTLGIPHGVANAIMLPHVIRYNADTCARELALVAAAMNIARDGRDDGAMALATARQVDDWAAQMHLPRRLSEVGVSKDQLALVAELAASSRTVQNNPKPVDTAQVAALLSAAW